MRVIVLGAGGRLGSRVLAECVRQGHQATAFVRSSERLRAAVGDDLLRAVAVVEGDVLDGSALRAAMSGQEACVQAAGYIGKTLEESKPLHEVVVAAVQAANQSLVGPRRLWVMGGAGTLDLPGRRCMLVDVPGFPFSQYRMHTVNFNYLRRPEHASLDWSFACPGSMVDSPPGPPPPPARVVPDRLPFSLPGWATLLPDAALLPAVAAIRGQLVGPSYQEVAAAMVAHLEPGGPLHHSRVGFAAAAP